MPESPEEAVSNEYARNTALSIFSPVISLLVFLQYNE